MKAGERDEGRKGGRSGEGRGRGRDTDRQRKTEIEEGWEDRGTWKAEEP